MLEADRLQLADEPEPGALVQLYRGRIHAVADDRDHLAKALAGACVDQLIEQRCAESLPQGTLVDAGKSSLIGVVEKPSKSDFLFHARF